MAGSVTLHVHNSIGTIEFYHPKGNSLPKTLLTKLADTISNASQDEEIKVLVLKSSGSGAFCAGASFDELIAIENPEAGKDFFMGFANVILAMKSCTKLIISRVQGKAVGGGVGIIAASDYVCAHLEASIKLSELNLGIGPFVIAPIVERKIGISALSSVSINASSWKDAKWAYQKGLYNDVFDSSEALDEAIDALSTRLANSNPDAMMELKKILWKDIDSLEELLRDRAALSGRLAQSSYTKEFIEKFKKS